MSKKIVMGILAHVDAGKTTLSEAVLYLGGSIRTLGRVDHQDAFLDHASLERSRGITIFSKQAKVCFENLEITLLDTPGHVDFAAEMERTLPVLDYAVLVISGSDGVQAHTQTLWRLLERYQIPVFLFVNKMDQPGSEKQERLSELQKRLHANCIDFDPGQEKEVFYENLSFCEEELMEEYLETGEIRKETITEKIAQRKLFPCFFGSALKLQGVEELLRGLQDYTRVMEYPEAFGARIYKISRDDQGKRLTHMKITGGSLKAKTVLSEEEKADQIRIYSGAKYEVTTQAEAGTVCAVTGLGKSWAGQGLGIEAEGKKPFLEPVLTYCVELPKGCDRYGMLQKLKELEEEEPQLHIVWNEKAAQIHAQVMGEVQIEILQSLISQRYGVEVTFGEGAIVYKETIAQPVEGAGHFEPLRHYAEVRLLLEPGERGSGIQADSICSTDQLDMNWQRLILTHIMEKEHIGVLTGSAVTDLKITLLGGRAHPKHTEGGDFRQATYRAIRQGLMKAQSVLLEPYYEFRLEVPAGQLGRAIGDLQRMNAEYEGPKMEEEICILEGKVPVSQMRGYQRELHVYTKGCGRLFCAPGGYAPCHEMQQVAEAIGYDPERDLENPSGSVFCSHGAGFTVGWQEADRYMHTESTGERKEAESLQAAVSQQMKSERSKGKEQYAGEDELKEIFERTYGSAPKERKSFAKSRRQVISASPVRKKTQEVKQQYLLVDGYNIIFAWKELKELAELDIMAARTKLMDLLCNYQGFTQYQVILVFDAYKVEGYSGEVMKYHNIHVVYTKEAETADQYIEKTVRRMEPLYGVTVATSDGLEQVIIMGEGARRLSASDLREEMNYAQQQNLERCMERGEKEKIYLFDQLEEELAAYLEKVRLGKEK